MNNIERLGDLLSNQMKRTAEGNSSVFAELGTIGSNKSLKVTSIRNLIPKGQYMITKTAKDATKGDRVLVVWVGYEPIVVDIVSSS